MAKTSMKVKQQRPQKTTKCVNTHVVNVVEDHIQ